MLPRPQVLTLWLSGARQRSLKKTPLLEYPSGVRRQLNSSAYLMVTTKASDRLFENTWKDMEDWPYLPYLRSFLDQCYCMAGSSNSD